MMRKTDNMFSSVQFSSVQFRIIVSLCAHFVNTRIMPKCVGGRVSPCPSTLFVCIRLCNRKVGW